MEYEKQDFTRITSDELVGAVSRFASEGYRLVQICCTGTDQYEITYSFDKEYRLTNLRLTIGAKDPVIASITGQYAAAFTYENELQDLFGIKVEGLSLDYKGSFYKTAVAKPFAIHVTKPAGSENPTRPDANGEGV